MDTYSHVIPGVQEEAAGRLQRLLFSPTPVALPSDDENASRNNEERQGKSPVCRGIRSALGRTRTCGLLIRSQTHSRTGGDREGHRETKQRFYQGVALLEGQGGTGKDTQLRSDCGQNLCS